jgi:hypothetical protein
MVKELNAQFNIVRTTPTPEDRPIVSISSGWKFLLCFAIFFVIVKVNDSLEEILHVFRIGFDTLQVHRVQMVFNVTPPQCWPAESVVQRPLTRPRTKNTQASRRYQVARKATHSGRNAPNL